MIVKLIEVRVKEGHLAEYLRAQEIWNRETRRSPALLGMFAGQTRADSETIYLLLCWRSLADYEEWMATEHDAIARKAAAQEHYEGLVVRILEPVVPPPSVLPAGLGPGGASAVADVQLWSEVYRATFVLRTALRLGLFDLLEGERRSSEDIGRDLQVDAGLVERLCLALAGMQLVERAAQRWRNTAVCSSTLVRTSPAYQGHAILYNSRPHLLRYWSSLGEKFGLPPDCAPDDPNRDLELFLLAMADAGCAGQADALLRALDLQGCSTLLDVGGGGGHYAIALCRAYPRLNAVVLDRPSAEPLARRMIAEAGLQDRIQFVASDYRTDEFAAGFDAVLISNVLRGETDSVVGEILARAYRALTPSGQLIVADLFPELPPAPLDLRQGLFFLHMPEGANLSMQQMAERVKQAGFVSVRAERLTNWVTMNGIVIATPL